MKKYIKLAAIIIILSPIIYFLMNWGSALLKCEVLSIMHGSEFAEIYKENTMIGEIDYLKVLKYSDTYAEVYYIGKRKSGGDVVSFVKENNEWKFNEWERTVWSGVGGSASEVIWPYWWHFIYGGF